jgi:hypothetical protein
MHVQDVGVNGGVRYFGVFSIGEPPPAQNMTFSAEKIIFRTNLRKKRPRFSYFFFLSLN